MPFTKKWSLPSVTRRGGAEPSVGTTQTLAVSVSPLQDQASHLPSFETCGVQLMP